jgi:hypothetical protein
MNAFITDIWHDLREKRLWPVAMLLLIGLVAVPVLLAKPAPDEVSEPAVSTPPAAAKASGVPAVELANLEQIEKTSKLQAFDPKNPFKPKVKPVKLSASTVTALTQIANQTAGGTGGGSEGGGSTGGGGTTGGGTTPTAPTTPTTPGKRNVARYSYVIDVTFKHNGRTRRLRGMQRLSMLPGPTDPALLFLGVSAAGDDAVFLVDSRLDARGEGSCTPSAAECATVAIGAGLEHFFTDDNGNSYSLRVDEIRKVRVSKASASTAKKAGRADRTGVAATANAAATPIRRFVPPILADLVTVASPGPGGSSSDKDSR